MSEKYVKGYFLITYTGAQFLTCTRWSSIKEHVSQKQHGKLNT